MWHVICDMWHVTPDMWHVTHDTWHVTCLGGWTFSQNSSSLALTVCDLWYYEDLEEKADSVNELINELINHEAVYRPAPATPGLLNIKYYPHHQTPTPLSTFCNFIINVQIFFLYAFQLFFSFSFWQSRCSRGCSINSFVINSLIKSVSQPLVQISSKHCQSRTGRARELKFWENVHPTLCVMCHVSCVTCHVSTVRCHLSPVTCQM